MDTSGITHTPTDGALRQRAVTVWLAAVLSSLVWTVAAALVATAAAYAWLSDAVHSHVGMTEGPWSVPSVYVTIDSDPFPLAIVAVILWGLGLALIGGYCGYRLRHRVS
jgi:hypothetical protein